MEGPRTWMLYGANGYTGRLIARHAAALGHRPVLAGRRAERIEALAGELGLPWRALGLEDAAALDTALTGVAAVLHCAGPFGETAAPMVEACLRTGTHYLDITGEIEVFERLARLDARAREAGITLLPGCGFDVVPSDCLALHLKQRLPGATSLTLAFTSSGGLSRGTARTMVANLGRGGAVRRGGRIEAVPTGWRWRSIDFGRGPREAVTIPWGDVSTAWYSTGIPDIEVYTVPPAALRPLLRHPRVVERLAGAAPVRAVLSAVLGRLLDGPNAAARGRGRSRLYGEVRDAEGRTAVARLTGPEGYTLTVRSAVLAVERVLAGDADPGFQTPAKAFGADFVLSVEGVVRTDEAVGSP